MLMTIALPKPIFAAQKFHRKIWTNYRLIFIRACDVRIYNFLHPFLRISLSRLVRPISRTSDTLN